MNNLHQHSGIPSSPETIDFAANLAFFLLEQTGSIIGQWSGKMSAAQQRELMGRFIGKGKIIINGNDETVRNRVKVCFGQDYEDRNVISFAELAQDQRADAVIFALAEAAAHLAQDVMTVSVMSVNRSGRRFLVASLA